MTALRRRMLEDMQVRHLSAGTQQVYLQHIARFARYCGRSPAVLGPEEIRAYQLHLTNEKQLTPATLSGQIKVKSGFIDQAASGCDEVGQSPGLGAAPTWYASSGVRSPSDECGRRLL